MKARSIPLTFRWHLLRAMGRRSHHPARDVVYSFRARTHG